MSNWLELKHEIDEVDHAIHTLREIDFMAESKDWPVSGHVIDRLVSQLEDTKNSLLTELSECPDAALASPYYAQAVNVVNMLKENQS